jgi:hypothetical protein
MAQSANANAQLDMQLTAFLKTASLRDRKAVSALNLHAGP